MKQPGNSHSGKKPATPPSANCPAYKSLWKGRDGVWGREGKLFSRKVFPPFPNIPHYNKSPSQLKRPGRVATGIDLGGFSSMRAKKEYPAASISGRCAVMSRGHAG